MVGLRVRRTAAAALVVAIAFVVTACGASREQRLAWQDIGRPGLEPWLVLSGSPPRLLVMGIAGSFSPHGDRLAYMDGNGSILVLDTRSGRKRVIDSNGGAEPAWSPDGRHLAWRRTVGNFSQTTYIEVRALDGGTTRRFARPGELELGGWLNERELLLGDVDRPTVIDLTTGRTHALRARCAHPKPAPDGHHFTCMHWPGYRIAIGQTGSPQLRVLPLPHRILANYPAWSPNGQEIAFENQNDRSNDGLYVIRPDGTHLQRVANGFLVFPFWRP